jgi:hypothetical protein
LNVDYLRGHATASAIGLFVICRYLSAFGEGRVEEDLRGSLQLGRAGRNPSDEAGAVLVASLAIGDGLGVIVRENTSSPWKVDADLAARLRTPGDQWSLFRGELVRRIAHQGMRELETNGKAPDLVLGLAWFLQLDPLSPLHTDWGTGPEPLIDALAFDAVSRSEQWRPFQRWAVALGLAHRSDTAAAKVLIPDATTAIADQLPLLPASGTAREWLSALRERMPLFGSPTLLEALPKGGPIWDELPPGVVLGLLKLERAGLLSLQASDDALDVVSVGLGSSTRQVGRIAIRSS